MNIFLYLFGEIFIWVISRNDFWGFHNPHFKVKWNLNMMHTWLASLEHTRARDVTTPGMRLDALWLAPCALFHACSFQRSPPTTAPRHKPRPITLDQSLALANAGAAATSMGASRPKRHSARMHLSASPIASCACPRAWVSFCVDAERLPPLVGASRCRSPRVQRAPTATRPP